MLNRKYICLLFMVFLFQAVNLYSQTAADSISVVFPKVLVINQKKQVLLYYDSKRKAYEVPSIGTIDGPISYKTYLDSTALDMGIVFKKFSLGGLFTYIYPNEYSTFIRPYFVIQFEKYINESGLKDSSYKWFSYQDAINEIPYPASSMIVKKILFNPKKVWGASFEEFGYTNPVDRTKIKFKILEDFFILN